MDVLLDLIRRQNIDIYDIPMGLITEQFLAYCRRDRSDVDGSVEFVYTASLLIQIKSKMLLPRDDLYGAPATEFEDPRRELVDLLLNYKAAARMLLQREDLEAASWSVSGAGEFAIDDDPRDREEGVNLIQVFEDLLERWKDTAVHQVADEGVTVSEMIGVVKRRLSVASGAVSFTALIESMQSVSAAICVFLALLELSRLQAILLFQPEPRGDILIKKSPEFDQLVDRQAQMRDDWH